MQMFNSKPHHHLRHIVHKQEVLNIVNITNLIAQTFVNKNQSTDQCAILCFTSTRKYFAKDGEYWFPGRSRGRSNFNRSLVKVFPSNWCTPRTNDNSTSPRLNINYPVNSSPSRCYQIYPIMKMVDKYYEWLRTIKEVPYIISLNYKNQHTMSYRFSCARILQKLIWNPHSFEAL